MGSMRAPVLVILVLLALGAIQLAHYVPRLPETVAVHFDTSGAPNSWNSRTQFAITLASLEVLMAVIGLAGALLMKRIPASMLNIPNREFWLAPERREKTISFVAEQLVWIEAITLAFVLVVGQAVILAHLRAGPPELSRSFLLVLPVLGLALAFVLIRILKRFGRPTK